MSENASPNLWIPFQCPACHGLFRLRRSQVGQTGRCPTCRVAVIPTETVASNSGSVMAAPEEPPELLLERIAVAETMTAEEIERHEASRQKRKRQHVSAVVDKIDWEDEIEAEEPASISWKVVVSSLMTAVLLGASGIYFLKQATAPPEVDTALSEEETKTRDLLNEILETNRQTTEEDKTDVDVQAVDEYNKFDIPAFELAVKGFLEARNVEEMKKTIRDLERVGPLLDRYYAKVDFETEGFEALNKTQVSYQGNLLNTTVQKADFLSSAIAVERVVSDDGEAYKVDWESWVGYSDYTPEEMRTKKPTEPFLMRVIIEPANYYNYGFSDDQKWRSYGLELKDSVYSFLGYVKRDSDLDQRFMELLKKRAQAACIIKGAYQPDSRAKDQFEIVELVDVGWIENRDSFKDDE